MKLKTYRAATMAQAFAMVKADLGSQAVILHTRCHKAGGLLGLGAQEFVEITASDDPNAGLRPVSRSPSATTRSAASHQSGDLDAEGFVPTLPFVSQNSMSSNSGKPAARPSTPALPAPRIAAPVASLPELATYHARLIEQHVGDELARKIITIAARHLAPADADNPAALRAAALDAVASMLPEVCDDLVPARADDERPTTIALIGPTGVGKTTTIAKLAAIYSLKYGRTVGLLSLDRSRPGASEQLAAHAEAIGVPMVSATTRREVSARLAELHHCDIILIDTPGCSPRDAAAIAALGELLAVARPHQTHLVMSSTAAEPALLGAISAFKPLSCDRVVLTKLDEACSFGVLVNITTRLSQRLSFITMGQSVPEDIEPGDRSTLASLILDGQPAMAA